jgi:cytoskeletal protein RodZ
MGDIPNTTLANDLDSRVEAKARFAAWLTAARERSGLSLEAIAQETRISRGHLANLEQGQVEALPGKVFGRGFVKNITRLLKTDSAEGLRLYDACWGSAIQAKPQQSDDVSETAVHKTASVLARIAEPVDVSSTVSKRLLNTDYSAAGEKPHVPKDGVAKSALGVLPTERIQRVLMNPQIRLWVLSAIASAFVLLVFGRWVAQTLQNSTKKEIAAVATAEKVASDNQIQTKKAEVVSQESAAIADASEAVQPAAAIPAAVPAQVVQSVAPAEKIESAPAVAAKAMDNEEDNPLYAPTPSGSAFEQVLEVNVAADVEIRMTIDGKKLEKTWFEAKGYRFTFNEKAELYVTDASKVDLVYNGKSLGVLGNAGRKRRIFFQANASASDFPNY